MKSNFINNTQASTEAGIILFEANSQHRLYIEECIFQSNCQNQSVAIFCAFGNPYIYIFRTKSDSTKIAEGNMIYMSEMSTASFENDFFICLAPKMLIRSNKQNTYSVFDPFSYVDLFYQLLFSKSKK